ncbi:TRAP transporter large permease [Agitococcus lubricus]|uniref:TRAP transporter large permease protein n=1 Tax=Agitococcus lubricus TaxID=1077255 RepID=A0A2T5J2T0_9GAMM|nr:TRAP transporter large permease subunit [Agitococcus lubricus]PTQ90722.1 tripartite ATP-independent transporter DctM subunit [Agitococcus lubricus]
MTGDWGWLAPLMFLSLFLLLLTGYPVAFVLAAVGLIFGAIGVLVGALPIELVQAVPERLFGIMRNETLMAIPFFTLMGLILEKSQLAEDLLDAINQLFGRLRGGLAFAVILVGALLAATTGVVAASVMAMGLISLPMMMRQGYSPAISSGVIMASGTLAQIIPPSLVLIVLADTLTVPVGDMYLGAMYPSLALVALFALFIGGLAIIKPELLPAQQQTRQAIQWRKLLAALVPPLVLIFLVLGTIFIGLATPTEAGAMGAAGALVLALVKRRLSASLLHQALDNTAKLTSFVMFILVGSSLFALVFRALNGDVWVEHLFDKLPAGEIAFLLVVNLMVFGLGMFLDFFEIVFIVVPLLVPIIHKLNIDPVWFGVLLAMNLQTSFLTPPFGFSLFYLRSVAPKELNTSHLYKGAVPFIVLQLVMVVVLMMYPELVRHESSESTTFNNSQDLSDVGGQAASADEAIRLMQEIAKEYQGK